MSEVHFNKIPALTWTWLRMNEGRLEDELRTDITFKTSEYTVLSKPEDVKIISEKEFNTSLPNPLSALFSKTSELGIQYKSVDEISSDGFNTNDKIVIESSAKTSEPVVISIKANGRSSSEQIIHALPDSEISVILIMESDGENGINAVRTKCFAEENAKIHLSKIQLLDNGYYHIDSTENVCGENANIKFTELQLGAKSVYTGVYTNLSAYKALYKSNTAYYRKGDQKIDMNYVCCHNHEGKKTECSMTVAGTLKDNSSKTYRGTIDFKKGCSGSKGNETEETLLLSPKAVNRSVPIILCDEEDVEGEHGATIGRLSDDMLFYMQTRGIPMETAEHMISRAKITEVANMIGHEDTIAKIDEYLDKEVGL